MASTRHIHSRKRSLFTPRASAVKQMINASAYRTIDSGSTSPVIARDANAVAANPYEAILKYASRLIA